MDFEQFAIARDFYYLAAVLMGAGIGCVLGRSRKNSTRRSKNWALTVGLCFFSGAVTALTAAIIYSKGLILLETSLYPYLGVLTVVLILAFRFPKTAGFPIFLIAGVLIIWMGYTYLRFPGVDASGGNGLYRITREGNELVQLFPARELKENSNSSFSFRITGKTSALEFRVFFSSFSRPFPFVGGRTRGAIMEIKSNGGLLYEDTSLAGTFFPNQFKFTDPRVFTFWEVTGKLETRRLPPGSSLTVFLKDSGLVFR